MKRKVKRVKRKRKRSNKVDKTYSYKREGNALADTGKINLGDLTAHTFNGTWLNPAYEIANNTNTDVIAAMTYLETHKLSQIIGLNDFITFNEPPAVGTVRQLYGMYRINGIQIKLIPNLTSLDQTQGENRPTQIIVQSVKDDADLITGNSTEGRVKQFQTISNRKLVWNGKSTLSYYFKPKIHTTIESESPSNVSQAVVSRKASPWIRMTQDGVEVPHYGEKLFFKSTATFDTQLTNNFRVEKTFYISFKQVM